MITPQERIELLDTMPEKQAVKVQYLEAQGWTFISYNRQKAVMASPSRHGVSVTRTIHKDGSG